ncbi:hypothetical protein [Sulfobacillus thermosulfidooxidans]|uniref:hypothetical protein n=1 Tax=Sulfobacillus thermosulfidooxidans TaxID=28034 RepID=UPI00041388D7|nr:hypothetical protein [Sulfobacillus thermosulfidooxidans]
MKTSSRFMATIVGIGFVFTLMIAALVTHNSSSTPLTLAQVMITALIPLGLLGFAAIYYSSDNASSDKQTLHHS